MSIVLPTFNAAASLPGCLASLMEGVEAGLIREVIVSDAASDDATIKIADAAGARVVSGAAGRGSQLSLGAVEARGEWLLFLHADTRLEAGWAEEVASHISRHSIGEAERRRAAVFRLAFSTNDVRARVVALGANCRTRFLLTPYGDQGLLISREFYDGVGGYSDAPLFEDVDIVDRIRQTGGRRALRMLQARAFTDPIRYERSGYANRVAKNAICLTMYRAGRSPLEILKYYRAG